MVLLVPGVKRNATVSLLNALLDRVLTLSKSVPASRISMMDSAGSLDTIACVVRKNLTSSCFLHEQGSIQETKTPVTRPLRGEQKAFKSLCSGLVQQCGCPSNQVTNSVFLCNTH